MEPNREILSYSLMQVVGPMNEYAVMGSGRKGPFKSTRSVNQDGLNTSFERDLTYISLELSAQLCGLIQGVSSPESLLLG
jgi:hypothetical protein